MLDGGWPLELPRGRARELFVSLIRRHTSSEEDERNKVHQRTQDLRLSLRAWESNGFVCVASGAAPRLDLVAARRTSFRPLSRHSPRLPSRTIASPVLTHIIPNHSYSIGQLNPSTLAITATSHSATPRAYQGSDFHYVALQHCACTFALSTHYSTSARRRLQALKLPTQRRASL